MTAPMVDSSNARASKPIRTSVLIHPTFGAELEGRDVTFLTLPHPRTHIPTYYLATTEPEQLLELGSLADTKLDRSWFLSSSLSAPPIPGQAMQEQVISKARLEILSAVDVRFLVISILDSLTTSDDADAGVFRSAEDAFEQAAAQIYRTRKDELTTRVAAMKANGATNGAAAHDGEDEEWTDILTFANLPIAQRALRQVADVQELSGSGEESQVMYRLSRPKIYAEVLAPKLAGLSLPATFAKSPNMLATSFHRRWPHPSDPSMHLDPAAANTEAEAGTEAHTALQLRRQIAAEIIAAYLPPALALDWFQHLGLPSEQDSK